MDLPREVLCHLDGEVPDRPAPVITEALSSLTNPTFHSPSPHIFFLTLTPDEARAQVELFGDEAIHRGLCDARTSWEREITTSATTDVILILQILNIGEWVGFFANRSRRRERARVTWVKFEPAHLSRIEDHAFLNLNTTRGRDVRDESGPWR